MAEENQEPRAASGTAPSPQPAAAPTAPETPAAPPLRAVFLVWPGRMHAQTWLFLWLGVFYLVAALLPWDGAMEAEYVLADGRTMSAADYHLAVQHHPRGGGDLPAQVSVVREPGMGIGAVLLLVAALGVVITGVTNIWNRKLTLWPTLLAWILALCVIYFSKGLDVDPVYKQAGEVGGFQQVADTFAALFGDFGRLIGGRLTPEMTAVLDRFGMGFYVCMVAEIFLVLFIIGSIVAGMIGSKKEEGPPKGARAAGARRPGARR